MDTRLHSFGRNTFRHCVLMLIALGGMSYWQAKADTTQRSADDCERSGQAIDEASKELWERLEAGAAVPDADAQENLAKGDFGFAIYSTGPGQIQTTPGIVCYTPYGHGIGPVVRAGHGDHLTEKVMRRAKLFSDYAVIYNRTVIEDKSFPIADLCRPTTDDEPPRRGNGQLDALSGPARKVERSPLTIHEAARRGTRDEVRAFFAIHAVDEPDCYGMTALAWAVSYGRNDIVALLLAAGAQSMPSNAGGIGPTPVLAAIGQKRIEILRVLQPPNPYPARYVEAAIQTDNLDIVRQVLASPHEAPREFRSLTLEIAEALIESDGPALTNRILLVGAKLANIELVELALANGADPDLPGDGQMTPLLAALDRYDPDPLPVVVALIAAGADVNQRIKPGRGFDTPFWKAYRRANSSERRLDVFLKLVAAGGDASIPIRPGTPSAWTVFFPATWDLTQLEPPSVDLLEILMKAKMNLNEVHESRCILDAVEGVAGPDSDIVAVLKRLGAKRMSSEGRCSSS